MSIIQGGVAAVWGDELYDGNLYEYYSGRSGYDVGG